MGKKRKPFMTGYCSWGHGAFPCPGQVVNTNKPGKVSLCSCPCHGDLTARLQAVEQGDDEVLDPDDLAESLEQMRAGVGTSALAQVDELLSDEREEGE